MNEIMFAELYAEQFRELAALEEEAKELEKQRKEAKAAICKAMEENGIKAFENDTIKLTYVAPTVSIGVDWKALQFEEPKKYAKIAQKYSKETRRSAYVKITPKR